LKKRIHISDIITLEKVVQNFNKIKSFYFSEVNYDIGGSFFDLYIWTSENRISENQIKIYNELIKNFDKYSIEINDFIQSTYSNYEIKKLDKLNNLKLNIDIISIPYNNENFEAVLVCGKQYKLFGFLKKNIDVRVEFKYGNINSIERKPDTTKENETINVLQHDV